MKKFLLLVSICIIPFVLCDSDHDIPIEPTPMPPKPPTTHPTTTSTTTTQKPSPTPPKTTTPTTTTSTTTSTTTTPTTTSSTTTVKPTTPPPTTAPPTTSTSKPTPKPTVPPTPAPTPTPEPTMGKWSVNFTKSNMSCILMDAATQIEVLHPNATSIKMNVPTNATSIGDCKGNQTIILTWTDSKVNVSLQFEFSKINGSKFELETITCNMTKDNSSHSLHHHRSEFITPLANSYKCARVQTLNLTDDKNNTAAYLHISHLQLQAYGNSSSHNFESANDCDASISSDVIPIVVGCVLAILVVAVLGAYLVGRRRCQARGYLSM